MNDADYVEREYLASILQDFKNDYEILERTRIKPQYLLNEKNRKLMEFILDYYKKNKTIVESELIRNYSSKGFDIVYYFELLTEQMYCIGERGFRIAENRIIDNYKNSLIEKYNEMRRNKILTFDEYASKVKKLDEIKIIDSTGKMLTAKDINTNEQEVKIFVKSGIDTFDKKINGFILGELSVWSGGNACVDCDTEYFNGYEWKKIADYKNGDKVLQYNADGTAELVIPEEYIKVPCDKLYTFKNTTGTINQCVSEEHRIIYITSKNNLYEKRFYELKNIFKNKSRFSGKIIPYFDYSGDGIDIDENVLRLKIAVSADGSKYKRKWRIRVFNEEKIKRLRYLITKCGLKVDERIYKDKSHNFYVSEEYGVKSFPKEWYFMNKNQFKVIEDEIYRWDGRINSDGGIDYSTVIKSNADFIQFVLTSLGKRTSLNTCDRIGEIYKEKYVKKSLLYNVHQCKNNSLVCMNNISIKEYKTKDNFKYCFKVPSGMLVLRRNNSINITGNSAKSTFLNQLAIESINQDYKVAIYSGELTSKRLMNWICLQCAGKNNISFNQEKNYYFVNSFSKEKIINWLNDKLYVYDNDFGNKAQDVIESITDAISRFGIKVIILDNLMSMDLNSYGDNKYDVQSKFIQELSSIAKKYNVHIHFICHPRKVTTFLRKVDISGSGDITNVADNVFIMHRVNQDFKLRLKEMFKLDDDNELFNYSNVLEICKNREYGLEDVFIGMYFDISSKRLLNYENEVKKYGWEDKNE